MLVLINAENTYIFHMFLWVWIIAKLKQVICMVGNSFCVEAMVVVIIDVTKWEKLKCVHKQNFVMMCHYSEHQP